MSTPTKNSVPVTYGLNPNGLGNVGALVHGEKWGGSLGTGLNLTYSFPTGTATFIPGYEEFSSWYALSATERDGVRTALNAWSSVANVGFTEVPDNESVVGDLRFTITDLISKKHAAFATYPHDHPSGGDVWFSLDNWHETSRKKPVVVGSHDYRTILHEIGHALGLKHPFDGPVTIDSAFDSYSFTVMSYSTRPGDDDNWASIYPTTPMWFDILAIETLYGERPHNPGDTVYAYSGSKPYWETIDDTAGSDTIKVAGSEDTVINLNIGNWSKIGEPIKFNHGKQTDTVMIGPNTVIEKAVSGSGDDRLIGNAVSNTLNGREGNDSLTGLGGADYLLGGKGKDKFVFNAAFGTDTIADFSTKKGDVITLDDALFGNFAAVTQALSLNGSSQVVITAGADSITLASVHDVSALKANDFAFV